MKLKKHEHYGSHSSSTPPSYRDSLTTITINDCSHSSSTPPSYRDSITTIAISKRTASDLQLVKKHFGFRTSDDLVKYLLSINNQIQKFLEKEKYG